MAEERYMALRYYQGEPRVVLPDGNEVSIEEAESAHPEAARRLQYQAALVLTFDSGRIIPDYAGDRSLR